MSGLIWAGIGKGIADAGQTFGAYMAKDIEANRLSEREALREERLLARQEALEQLKADREETKAKKDAEIYAKAEEAAPGVGEARRFEQFKKDVGQTDMTEEDMRQVFKDQYDQTKVGEFKGADRYLERYSKLKEDVLSEIRRAGGSSGLINQAVAEVKGAREAERAADKLALDERKLAEIEQRRREEFRALLPFKEQMAQAATTNAAANTTRAGAAVTNANTPRGGGSDNTDRDITAAENALSNARARVEKGFREPTIQEKYDPAKLTAYTKEKNAYVENDPDVKRQRARVERLNSGGGASVAPAAPKSGDNRTSTSGTAKKDYSTYWK